MYFDYVRFGVLHIEYLGPRAIEPLHLELPVLVNDSIDDICRVCRPHPARNYCAGPKTREGDHEAAEILSVEIERAYDADELIKTFQAKAIKHGLNIGTFYDLETLMEKFYGRPVKI
ncbi:MAG: hypothetical protein HZB67_02510 [Candidatus Aenigmarchaeota archaeon]|nr:hypothetical protein [Candidatus Aenigmarchaeota archaeon]